MGKNTYKSVIWYGTCIQNMQTTPNLIVRWQKKNGQMTWEDILSKKDIWMANKYMQRYSTLLLLKL